MFYFSKSTSTTLRWLATFSLTVCAFVFAANISYAGVMVGPNSELESGVDDVSTDTTDRTPSVSSFDFESFGGASKCSYQPIPVACLDGRVEPDPPVMEDQTLHVLVVERDEFRLDILRPA